MAEEAKYQAVRDAIAHFNKRVDWWLEDLVYKAPECYPMRIFQMSQDLISEAQQITTALRKAGIQPDLTLKL